MLQIAKYLLQIPSYIYGMGVVLYHLCYKIGILKSFKLKAKVISVGNITLGGAGKTPMTAYIADFFKNDGTKVVVLSRGYKRKGKGINIVSDGVKINFGSKRAGDEAYLLAKSLPEIPIVVGKDRIKAGKIAEEKFDPEIIILDDGFQYLRLKRELDIVAIDSSNPFGNKSLLPGGVLREPLCFLKRADLFVLTRTDQSNNVEELKAELKLINPNSPIVESVHMPYFLKRVSDGTKLTPKLLQGKRVFAFSGIANCGSFEKTLKSLGAKIVGVKRYPDHHRYKVEELNSIDDFCKKIRARYVLTTQKDETKLPGGVNFKTDLLVLGIKLKFFNEKFNQILARYKWKSKRTI